MRHIVLVLFFVGLAALEIAHGVFRLHSVRESHREKLIEGIEREASDLVRSLRSFLLEEREHAAYLARSPAVRGLLCGPAPEDEARRALEAHLLPYIVCFRGIDRVRILDARGIERFRCERIGNGVGALPPALLEELPDSGLLVPTRDLPEGEVAISNLAIDLQRVEVPEGDRQVLHYATGIDCAGSRVGVLALTVYAAPLLNAVRRFAPVSGVSASLVDAGGAYIASRERARERGGARLEDDFPEAVARILAGATRAATESALILSAAVSEAPAWRFVTAIPEAAVEAASGNLRSEYGWVMGSMAAITMVLAAAGVFFVRLSVREVRLREREKQKELERQLQISERLGSLGLLTAGVAHEINNPLEGIGNYLALLEREHLSPEKRQGYVEHVRYGFNRIRDIVRDLSAFAPPAVSSGTADLSQVVRQALKMAAYAKEFKAVRVEQRGLDQPLVIPGDRGRLEQVFINLLLNAGRAMNGQGTVVIQAGEAAATDPGEQQVEIAVADTGPGIPEAILDKIFDPFFTTTEGTGLGLSISYGIVRAHGGTLTAQNRPEGGACFTLRLPGGKRAAPPRRREKAEL